MPATVDTRVVEMRFNNKKFEANAEETLKTLKKLDDSLDLSDSAKSFTEIQRAAEKVDLSKLQNAAEAVTNKFSALGVITDQVLRNMTTSVSNAVTGMIRQFTIAPITAGFDKYASKTEAVQTIMHATGEDIDSVNESLMKLSEYTDETSYSFSDMVGSISKFTGAGLDLRDAEMAAEGIANWAATAGVGASKASGAFYNIAQAMSSGALRAQDWKSIEILNMNTIEFEQAAIDAAQAMIDEGRASQEMQAAFKKANPSVEGFRDTLSSGWLTKDVMTEVFKVYADTSTDFGLAAYKAAQEAKTFKDVVEATAEAVGSGWANVFEQIFGNYEEARVLWTNVANELYEVFTAPTTWLTDILTEWHSSGGYVDFIESVKNIWESIKGIVTSLVGVVGEVFPVDMVDVLTQATAKLRQFSETMRSYFGFAELPEIIDATRTAFDEEAGTLGEVDKAAAKARQAQKDLNKDLAKKHLSPIVETFRGLLSIFKAVASVSGGLLKIALPFVKLLVPIANLITTITGKIGELISGLVDLIFESKAYKNMIEFLTGVSEGIVKWVGLAINYVADFIENFREHPLIKRFGKALSSVKETLKEFASPIIERGKNIISGFFNWIGKINWKPLLTVFGAIAAAFGWVIKTVGNVVTTVYTAVAPYISAFANFVKSAFSSIAEVAGPWLSSVWEKLTTFFSGLSIDKVTSKVQKFIKTVKKFPIIQKFLSLLTKIKDVFSAFASPIIEKARTFFSNLGLSFASAGESIEKVSLIDKIRNLFNRIVEAVKKIFGGADDELGASMSPVKDAILSLFGSDIPKNAEENLERSATVLTTLHGLFDKVLAAFKTLKDYLDTSGISGLIDWAKEKLGGFKSFLERLSLGEIMPTALGIAGIAGVVKAYGTLKKVDGFLSEFTLTLGSFRNLANNFAAIPTNLNKSLTALSDSIKTFNKTNAIVQFAVAIAILTLSLTVLATTANQGGLEKGVLAMAELVAILLIAMIGLNAALGALEKNKLSSTESVAKITASMVTLALVLVIVAKALEVVAPLAKDKTIWRAFGVLSLLLVVLAATAVGLSFAKEALLKTSVILVIIAAALAVLVGAIALLIPIIQKIESNNLLDALRSMAGGLIAMFAASVAIGIAAKLIAPQMLKIAAAVAILSGVVLVLVTAMKKISSIKITAVLEVLGVLGLLIGAISLLARISNKLNGPSGAIIKVSASLLILVAALYGLLGAIFLLSALNPTALAKGVLAVSFLITVLARAMVIASKATAGGKVGFGLAAMALVIVAFAASIALLSYFDFKKLIGPAIALTTLIVILSAALGLMSRISKGTAAGAKFETFGVALAIAIAAVAGALIVLSYIEPHKLLSAVIAMTSVLLALGLMLLAGQEAIKASSSAYGLVSLVTLVVIIGGIAAALWFIAKIPIANLAASTLAIAHLLLLLSISFLSIGFMARRISPQTLGVSLIMPIAILGAIVGAIWALSALPVDQVVGICNALSKVLPALGIAIAGMSIVAAGAGGITLGGLLAAFGLVIAFTLGIGIALTALAVLAGLLAKIEGIKEFLQGGVEVMSLVGEVIGSIIGGFITGALGPLLEGVPKLMGSLTEFITGIGDFLDKLNALEIDQSKIDALGGVATMILKLTAAELLESLSNWISGGKTTDFASFAKGLKDLGKGVKDYETALGDGVDSDKIAASASAVEAIAEVAKKMPREGGWIDAILGRATTLGEFAQEMSLAAPNIMAFANQSHGIASHEQDIVSCAVALRALVDVANAIQPDTSWDWSSMSRETSNLLTFARTLGTPSDGPSIGEALSAFASDTSEIKTGQFRSVIGCLGKLVEVGNKLSPTTNSDMNGNTWTTYTESANAVAEFLRSLINGENGESLGKNLAQFATDVKDVDSGKVRSVANAIGNLAAVGEKMVPTDVSKGWGWYKSHTQTLGEFIQSLASPVSNGETIASYLKTFATDIAGVDADAITSASEAIGALVAVGSSIQTVTTLKGNKTTIEKVGDLGRFLEDLAIAGPNLKTFSDSLDDTVLDKLSKIKAIFNGFTTISTSLAENPDLAAGIYNFAGGLNSAAGLFVESCGLFNLVDLDTMRTKVEEIQSNQDILDKVTSASEIIMGAFENALTAHMTNKKSTIANSIVGEFADAIKAEQYQAFSAGAYSVIGFVDGINSELWRVSQVGSNLSETAIQTLRRILRISSPSKVMMELGSYTGQGFVKGLSKWVEPASDTSSSLAESMLASVASVIDYVQAILNGELAVDLTIRPVLDLSNISGGASTINSMFSRRQAINANIGGTLSGSRGEVSELVSICWKILGEIQNGSDIYIDDDVLAGRINRRLARP